MANPLVEHSLSNATAPAGSAVQSLGSTAGSTAGSAAPLTKAANATAEGLRELGNAASSALGDATQSANGAMPPAADMWGGYFQALGAVFLLLAVLAMAFWLLKRYGPKAGLRSFHRGSLKLEAQLPLGPKRSVTVVRFLNKQLVLGVTETRINLLTTVDADHEAENTDFSDTLAKAQKPDSPS